MGFIAKKIAEKQKLYYSLPNEINNLISNFEGSEIKYRGKVGLVNAVYADSMVEISLFDENDEEYFETVHLTALD